MLAEPEVNEAVDAGVASRNLSQNPLRNRRLFTGAALFIATCFAAGEKVRKILNSSNALPCRRRRRLVVLRCPSRPFAVSCP